jgi:hypothetical protein
MELDDSAMTSASCPEAVVALNAASPAGAVAATQTFHTADVKSGTKPAGNGGSGGKAKMRVAFPGKAIHGLSSVGEERQTKLSHADAPDPQSVGNQKPVPPPSWSTVTVVASHWWVVHPNIVAAKKAERKTWSL